MIEACAKVLVQVIASTTTCRLAASGGIDSTGRHIVSDGARPPPSSPKQDSARKLVLPQLRAARRLQYRAGQRLKDNICQRDMCEGRDLGDV